MIVLATTTPPRSNQLDIRIYSQPYDLQQWENPRTYDQPLEAWHETWNNSVVTVSFKMFPHMHMIFEQLYTTVAFIHNKNDIFFKHNIWILFLHFVMISKHQLSFCRVVSVRYCDLSSNGISSKLPGMTTAGTVIKLHLMTLY